MKKLYVVICEHFVNNMTEHQTDIHVAFSHEDLACRLSLLWNACKITNNTDPWFILLLYSVCRVSDEKPKKL